MGLNSKSGTINIVRNVDPADTRAGNRSYRYHDQHVDDTQSAVSFAMLRNGWKATFDIVRDEYNVTSPSGLMRTYVRV